MDSSFSNNILGCLFIQLRKYFPPGNVTVVRESTCPARLHLCTCPARPHFCTCPAKLVSALPHIPG
ncbi:hypothetical protein ACRRTK_005025 [Alexandromys fortis]